MLALFQKLIEIADVGIIKKCVSKLFPELFFKYSENQGRFLLTQAFNKSKSLVERSVREEWVLDPNKLIVSAPTQMSATI